MKELLALIIVSVTGFVTLWCAIFGIYFLVLGLLYGMGDVYVVVGVFLIVASLFLGGLISYYLRGKPSFYKRIFDKLKTWNK